MNVAVKSTRAPFECPNCGADVPANARACPECGADERTGWNEEATRYDGLDLPSSEDNPSPDRPRRSKTSLGISRFWWIIGIALALLLIYLQIRGVF
ncbi:MAG: zinc ribbon domain-containing protein [Opitutaceae bacterium]|nr:zinc ribbon domain-containing protein [Opitutaceae bacterium]